MTENVMENLEVRQDIAVLLETAQAGITALKIASTMIEIPAREKAKIQTAVKKMKDAMLYIENRMNNLPVKSDVTTKSAVKDALKGATQEQIERAYAILTGKDAAYETPEEELTEGGAMAEDAYYVVPLEGDEE